MNQNTEKIMKVTKRQIIYKRITIRLKKRVISDKRGPKKSYLQNTDEK